MQPLLPHWRILEAVPPGGELRPFSVQVVSSETAGAVPMNLILRVRVGRGCAPHGLQMDVNGFLARGFTFFLQILHVEGLDMTF